MPFELTAVSHRGAVRTRNEDTVAIGPWVACAEIVAPVQLTLPGPAALALVCDGLGGHPGGDVASRLAAAAIAEAALPPPEPPESASEVARWVSLANDVLYARMALEPSLAGMGTTVAGVYAIGDDLVVFNVGDSRVYRWQDGYLCQLSVDDTFGMGADRPLSQCLGGHDRPTEAVPHMLVEKALPGRRYLICSDGLYNAVPLEAMEAALDAPPALAAAQLLERALAAGAADNVSFVLL